MRIYFKNFSVLFSFVQVLINLDISKFSASLFVVNSLEFHGIYVLINTNTVAHLLTQCSRGIKVFYRYCHLTAQNNIHCF